VAGVEDFRREQPVPDETPDAACRQLDGSGLLNVQLGLERLLNQRAFENLLQGQLLDARQTEITGECLYTLAH
jgi:hypothetical protein